MAWTAPSTKTQDVSTLTAADWNTYVRDNLEALVERPTWSLRLEQEEAAPVPVAPGFNEIISWYEEVWDSHGMHSLSSNRSRVTCQSGWAGIYLFCVTVTFDAGDKDGYRRVRVLGNGSTVWAVDTDAPQGANDRCSVHCIGFANLAVGDYLEVEVRHEATVNTLELFAGNDDDELGTTWQGVYLGAAASTTDAFTFEGLTGTLTEWWNDEVVASFNRLRSRPCFRAQTSSGISATNGTWTTLLLGTENFDTDGLHSTSVETSRFTAPRAGFYLLVGEVQFENNSVGQRRIRFRRDGTATNWQTAGQAVPGLDTYMRCMMLGYFTAGQYADLQGLQASGSTLSISGWLGAVWLGETPKVAGSQRLVDGYDDSPYAGGGQTGVIPRAWLNIHTRDLPGILYNPPLAQVRARFARDIETGQWVDVPWNRQQFDTWDTIRGKRDAGKKYVVPVDGLYLAGTQLTIKDQQVLASKVTLDSKTISSVDTANDYLTVTGHGYRTGVAIRIAATTTMPGGLVSGRQYHARVIDANQISLHPTVGDAQGNTNKVDITSAGSGTRTVNRSVLIAANLNLRNGTVVQFTTTGTLPGGLSTSTNYYVIRLGPKRFRVAPDEEAADDGVFTHITDAGSGTHTVRVMEPYGARGTRVVHSGEVQGGFLGQPSNLWQTSRPVLSILAAEAEDEVWVQALTKGPDGSRITAANPASRFFAVWCAPFAYTGADPISERA
jgi:hypothetical protein